MSALVRATVAESIGTVALLTAVVGSGIMAERLSAANPGVALLANALATGFALYVAITALAPVSGAHFNPVVTVAALLQGQLRARLAMVYVCAQFVGAIAGVALAHAMFELPLVQEGTKARGGLGQWIGEAVATAGLLLTISSFGRIAPGQVAAAVGAYIAGAYWFTSSTSFANPAVTVARAMTDTFAGIRPGDVAGFIASQIVGLGAGLGLARVLFPPPAGSTTRPEVMARAEH